MLDGKMYTLNPSSWDKNHIHGGTVGFDKKLWVGNIVTNGVELFYSSPGSNENFFKHYAKSHSIFKIIVGKKRIRHRLCHIARLRNDTTL